MRAWLLALAACGHVDFDPLAGGATSCLPAWKSGTIDFDPPVLIPELASPQRRANPALWSGGLRLFFDDFSANNGDIWRAERPTTNDPWTVIGAETALDSSAAESRASVSGDELTVILASARGGAEDLWCSVRPTALSAWPAPTQMYVGTINAAAIAILDPQIRQSGLRLYFSDSATTNMQSLAFASRLDTGGNFTQVVTLTELQNSTAVGDPIASFDEEVLLFSSGNTAAQNDIFYATRTSNLQPFGTPQLVPGVNAAGANDGDIEMSADFCTMYFRSDRDGHDQLYVAHVRQLP